jgi:Na+-transporting NADH:ubiquinone oxidoreductase subunit F
VIIVDLAFFVAPLAISGISAGLALVISITDKIVNNYGECQININEGAKEMTVDGGGNLLVTLAENKIFIPSACGGRGSCGECKVKVTNDIGPTLPTEVPWMSKKELEDNVRLSCQTKIKTDIDLEIPDELFKIQEFTGTVETVEDVTHDIKEVYFKLEGDKQVDFKAGQYGQVEVPPYGKIKESTQRAYSMCSKPSDTKRLGFLIRLVPGGVVTTYVHEHLNVGDRMKIIAPMGDFYIREERDDTMIWVAGGSGMAPFKSILYDRIERGLMDERDIWYFFGARTEKDMFYLDELYELDEQYERFHFVPALSEPDEGSDWRGETGLITDVLDTYLKSASIPPETPKEGYLCGSPGMLDACMEVMHSNDMTEDKIFFDKFA